MQNNFFIIVSGPTAVGKTDFVNTLAAQLPFPVEYINADVGQMYVPLAIGTAKPDYAHQPIKHHLFDIISQPRDFTVSEFRELVLTIMKDMWARGVVPLIVGGSGFYVQSLFFPPTGFVQNCSDVQATGLLALSDAELLLPYKELDSLALWQQLNMVDSSRAQSIHPNDRYRVERALILWHRGCKPSTLIPPFDPPGTCAFYFLTRDRDQLYERINQRTDSMLKSGWIDEVKSLDDAWKNYLLKKKLIGYPEIIQFLERAQELGGYDVTEVQKVSEQIKSSTRAYAKRQLTYWRMLRKKLEENDPEAAYIKKISELNLTISSLDLYIEKVCRELCELKGLPFDNESD